MTDVYFYPRWSEQEGWTQASTPQTFKVEYFGGINVDPGRDFITRFSDVDLPAGATITNAVIIYYIYSKKEDKDTYNFTYDYLYEATATGGTTIRQDATPLRSGVAEDSTANRTWGANHVTGGTFNWSVPLGDNQQLQVNVTSLIQQAVNTNGGRHMSLAFKLKVLTENGDMGIGNNASGFKQRLLVQYTGGTTRNEVVTVNENSNFTLSNGDVPTTGAPAFWVNNQVFGTYQANPTYTVASTFSGIPAAPGGGNIFKVTSTEADKRAAAWHMSPNDLSWGQWYCFSVFVYVPVGIVDVKITSFLTGVFDNLNKTSIKGAWTRLYVPVLVSPDQDPFLGVGTVDPLVNIGDSFYIANTNFTKGNHLYPYFDGSTADTSTFHRTFDYGGGTTGHRTSGISYVTLDNAPSVTGVTAQPSMSTHQDITSYWNYTDPYGEAQSRFRAEIRKKRVP